MRKRILRDMFLLSLGVLLLTLSLSLTVLYNYYSESYSESICQESRQLAQSVNAMGLSWLKTYPGPHRVTVIAADGQVLYDSSRAESEMENHADREEVMEALESGSGYAERHSSTIEKKTVNAAVLLESGAVLRLSDNQPTVLFLVGRMNWQLLLVLALTVLAAFYFSWRTARAITAPINQMDLDQPGKIVIYSELKPLTARLERQRLQISRQMQQLQQRHEEQDAMRRDFTANVSHELRTPLTSISGYAEIIRDGLAQGEDARRFAGTIHQEAQRLITLVEDIINLSRLEGKDLQEEKETIDLQALCRTVLQRLQPAAELKDVQLSLQGEAVSITGVSRVVEEMVYNLCDNAVKYNRPGGSVTVTVRQCLDGVELAVADTGVGIAEKDLDHIFERFYRGDKNRSRQLGGTGLGLSIVKHGARFHNAVLSVESREGEGTIIRVLF